MAYDNLKLEKGLYTTGKSFTQALEQIDPSENYAGTPLEGLDAYQRQLKRFDIKVSGIGSDTVSKFFQTSDSAALFPEYVSRAVRQGMEQADVLQKIVATTTVIDGMDYRAIESVENGERLTAAEVAEGASLPTTTVQVKDTLTEMHKRGRMLVASYEAVKFQKLDLFTVTLRQIGNCIAEGQLLDAYAALIGVHDSGITLEAGYFADKKISRRRYVNVAAYPPEQRQQVLLRKLEQAAARYRRLEVVLTGAHRLPLYAPVVPKDGVPDSAGFRIFQREITGTARQVQTRLVLCCQPKLEAMYYVAE